VKQTDPGLNRRIGDAVRAARLSRGVTQEDLANMLGVDRVTVARYESGLRTLTAPTLFTIFEYLEVPLNDMVGAGPLQDARNTNRISPALQEVIALLEQHPDLVPSVQELLDTMIED
jgi:transcriptional regulator with XRE-family HTH domain